MFPLYQAAKQLAGVQQPPPAPRKAIGGLVPLTLVPPGASGIALVWNLTGEKWGPDTAAQRLAAEYGPALPSNGLEKEIRSVLSHIYDKWEPVGSGEALVDIEVCFQLLLFVKE